MGSLLNVASVFLVKRCRDENFVYLTPKILHGSQALDILRALKPGRRKGYFVCSSLVTRYELTFYDSSDNELGIMTIINDAIFIEESGSNENDNEWKYLSDKNAIRILDSVLETEKCQKKPWTTNPLDVLRATFVDVDLDLDPE